MESNSSQLIYIFPFLINSAYLQYLRDDMIAKHLLIFLVLES